MRGILPQRRTTEIAGEFLRCDERTMGNGIPGSIGSVGKAKWADRCSESGIRGGFGGTMLYSTCNTTVLCGRLRLAGKIEEVADYQLLRFLVKGTR